MHGLPLWVSLFLVMRQSPRMLSPQPQQSCLPRTFLSLGCGAHMKIPITWDELRWTSEGIRAGYCSNLHESGSVLQRSGE